MTNKLFSVVAVAFLAMSLFSACDKKSSTDTPLTPTYNASVYIGGDNHIIYAIDPMTGLKNWEFSTSAPIYASTLIYNEMVYVGADGATYGDTLYKLNAQTGKVVKSFYQNLNPFHIVATPIASGGMIYLACTNNLLYALDTATLSIQWSISTSGAIRSSPVIYIGNIYFGCDDGNVYGYNLSTHNQIMQWNPFTTGVSTSPELFQSSPAIGVDSNSGSNIDTVLCIGGTNKMYCLKLSAVAPYYSFDWAYTTTGAVTSSPTIYGGACVFGCADFNVYCVDIYDGTFLRWKYTTGSAVTSSPYAYKNVIYVGSNDYKLYALNFASGTLKWYYATAGMVHSSPVVWGPYVYVGSYDKSFYAIDTALGQKKWSFVINNNIQTSPAVDNNTGGMGTNSSISGLTN